MGSTYTRVNTVILDYVDNYRPLLLGKHSGNTLLLNRNGDRYSGSAFSAHIKTLFHKLTGAGVSVNNIRGSFVSWTYGRPDCTDSLKDSLAAALRHTRSQAQRTYDKRTSNEKKQAALDLTREFAEENIFGAGPTADSTLPTASSVGHQVKAGQFMGMIEADSTYNKPRVLVGQIHALLPGRKVSLLWYKANKNLFRLQLDGESWVEDEDCLLPVNVTPVKNKPGCYRLQTSLREIHKSLQGET